MVTGDAMAWVTAVTIDDIRVSRTQPWELNNTALKSIRDMDEAVDAAVATMCTAVANQRRLEREHANNTAKAGEFK